jgi:DNA replication protein DnaC
LWPTERAAADLAAAREDLAGRQQPPRPREGDLVRQLERELDLCRMRDAALAARPPGCWCFGIGGHGRAFHPSPAGEPIATWRVWCVCSDAERLHDQVRQRVAAAEQLRRQANLERLWGSLPHEFADWTLESLAARSSQHAALVERIRVWLPTEQWLYLHGPTGAAKTGAAVGGIRALGELGRAGLYVEVSELLDRLRRSYSSSEAFDNSLDVRWNSLLELDVLLLDDIGAERHRQGEQVDWATEKLWQLIGYRHREGRRTILTSNHDLVDLAEVLGHTRIPSRIGERALVLDCSRLPDLRARTAA